jgi:hypothetical protein
MKHINLANLPPKFNTCCQKKNNPALVSIIYDGIGSSVFHGQVFQPLLTYAQQNPNTPIFIVSFEYAQDQKKAHALIKTTFSTTSSISFVIYKKYPYVGSINLMLAARKLRHFLSPHPSYTLRARGPLACAIALRAAHTIKCQDLVIQARGLVAAEYLYDHEQRTQTHDQSLLVRIYTALYRIRAQQFERLEKQVYALGTRLPATIEVVSPALKNYLITHFGAPAEKITIAAQDIPLKISPEQRAIWAHETRSALAIPEVAHVYCYSGSIKPWQCPELTIEFFNQQLQTNINKYLLVLTQDKNQFETMLRKSSIPEANYRVLTVAHSQIYRYLAAGDTGILFRKPHIVNWVSRPTKALEYYAAGLTIAHNNTIAYLAELEKQEFSKAE